MESKTNNKSASSVENEADSVVITVIVDVSYTGEGGNANYASVGDYQYSCVPSVVHVTKPGTVISYQMSPQVGAEFVFTGLYSSDSLYKPQLSKHPRITSNGRAIETTHANTEAMLINVALQVQDVAKQSSISCDPQVTNDPNPSW